MDREQVKALLDKFYEGTATPAEERQLRHYFRGEEVPEAFAADREFFLAVEEAGGEEPPAAFTRRLEELIDEHYDGTAGRTVSLRRWLWRTLPVAASLLVVLATWWYLASQKPKDTYSDPRLAYQETKRILLYVSDKLNEGTRPLSYLQEMSLPAREMERVGKTARIVKEIPYLQLPAGNEKRQDHPDGNR
jgi:hypothetical protein